MVVFAEVMFNEEISGEIPEHINFVNNVLKPWVENTLKVPFIVLRSERNFVERYLHILCRGKNKGKKHGFPIPKMCMINRDCKLAPINKFYKSLDKEEVITYIGIAADEPKRLERLKGDKISLLNKYGYTEQMAKELCEEYGLYSPSYQYTTRNGCWFCCNCKKNEWAHMVDDYPELFNKLVELEKVEVVNKKITRDRTPSQIKEWVANGTDKAKPK